MAESKLVATTSALRPALEAMVTAIKGSANRMRVVNEWIGRGYTGKVIGFTGEQDCYFVVFTRDDVKLRAGEAPSAEAWYRGPVAELAKITTGQLTAHAGAKSGAIRVWGSLSEAIGFEKVVKTQV